jgi:hypothetical protein
MEPKFADLYYSGQIEIDAINDYIEKWHNSDSTEEIYEYLGLLEYEYYDFVMTDTLPKK